MEIKRDEWLGFVRWTNFIVGFTNLYLFMAGAGYHLLAIATINIAVWVFTRRYE
tara:strand:- start:1176 stop:1337 length:162 start_codon:yes stop_codon:yes gene_type:complete